MDVSNSEGFILFSFSDTAQHPHIPYDRQSSYPPRLTLIYWSLGFIYGIVFEWIYLNVNPSECYFDSGRKYSHKNGY